MASDAAVARPQRDAGSRRALARLITTLEGGGPSARAALAEIYPRAGQAHVIGLTGPPGSGKSTLVAALTRAYRARGSRVAVLAVDPTSPYSGGALLGDRLRMAAVATDEDVFVRSMASRGASGGLALAAANVVTALDAAGYERILVETVGVGQAEVAVALTAHTTVVVTVPGLGDEVQALKAGVLEVADVLVVNKADRPDAEQVRAELAMLQSLAPATPWQPPILPTVALRGDGVPELVDAVEAHRRYLAESGEGSARAARRARAAVLTAAGAALQARLEEAARAPRWDAAWAEVAAHERTPDDVGAELLAALGLPTVER